MNDSSLSIVIRAVTLVWVLNFAAGLLAAVVPRFDWEIQSEYNAIFASIVGGLFTLDKLLAKNGAHGHGSSPKPHADVEQKVEQESVPEKEKGIE